MSPLHGVMDFGGRSGAEGVLPYCNPPAGFRFLLEEILSLSATKSLYSYVELYLPHERKRLLLRSTWADFIVVSMEVARKLVVRIGFYSHCVSSSSCH